MVTHYRDDDSLIGMMMIYVSVSVSVSVFVSFVFVFVFVFVSPHVLVTTCSYT